MDCLSFPFFFFFSLLRLLWPFLREFSFWKWKPPVSFVEAIKLGVNWIVVVFDRWWSRLKDKNCSLNAIPQVSLRTSFMMSCDHFRKKRKSRNIKPPFCRHGCCRSFARSRDTLAVFRLSARVDARIEYKKKNRLFCCCNLGHNQTLIRVLMKDFERGCVCVRLFSVVRI